MRSVFGVLVASLVVLRALFVLVSEDRARASGLGLMQREKASDAGDRLVQPLCSAANDNRIIATPQIQIR
jgi:hypothetical protein